MSRSVERDRDGGVRRTGKLARATATLTAALALALVATVTAPARSAPDPSARSPSPAGPSSSLTADSQASADTAFSCPAGSVQMSTLLEKTIFQVDVLVLEVCFGSAAAKRLASLASDGRYSEALADSLAAAALRAEHVRARIEFLREVDLDQFLDGIRENLGKAREADILTNEEYASIVESLPRWYAFLEDRGIREGDLMLYRIRGDTLRTAYRSIGGERLLDQTDVGPERRLSVLGGYFAPGSDFREGLVRSLLDGGGDG